MLLTKDRTFYKSLLTLTIPIALQNLITYSVGLADNVMIGALGDNAVSGVYMAGQLQTLLQVFSGGIEGSILVLAAQYWGKRDTERIRCVAAVGLRFSLLFGLLLTAACAIFPRQILSLFTPDAAIVAEGASYLRIVCFSYAFFCLTQALIASMRSVESPKVGMYVSLCSLVLDVALNYLLIFGKWGFPALGVRGAAIATLLSRVCETVLITVYVLRVDKKLQFRLRDVLHGGGVLTRDFIRYGTPIIAGQMVWAANMLIGSAILGRQPGEGVVAAVSVTNNLHNLTYVVMNGMAGAVGIITGKTIGAGQEERMREYAKTVQILFLILGVLTGGVVQLLKNPFISLYRSITPEAAAHARRFINVISVTVIGTCYQCACLFGLVKSGGDISFVFKNDAIFVFLVVLPSAAIATRLGLAPWIVFACLKSDQILKCLVAVIKINRYDWMKNLTRNDQSAPHNAPG